MYNLVLEKISMTTVFFEFICT